MTRFKQMFTFSNVIACIALFAALGGTVYAAGKISGSQIKPKSIPANRIKPNSLTGKQVKAGSLTGTQVKAGSLTGKQVVGSSLTGVSASSLGSVQYAVTVVSLLEGPPSGTGGTANCPVGTKVIGGGATLGNEELGIVNDSGPTTTRTGWSATGFGFGPGTTMTVTAICTAVTTTTG